MKTIIKTFCATMVALFTTTALAVEPIAVWSGFGDLESGSFTADIGSLVPDAKTGAVTLGSNGIKFANSGDAWSGSTKGWTVAVKYSTFASGTAGALVSLQQNSETSAAGIDKIGAWVNANGKVQGLWQAAAYGTADGTLPASGVVFVRYKDANGTSVHLQDGTSLYAAGGLKSSNNNWGKSFAVGSFANGTSNVASGLTVEAVAIFDLRISDADMASYEFPEPSGEYETLTYDGFLTTTFVDTGWKFDLNKLEECEITGTMNGSYVNNGRGATPSIGYWVEGPDSDGVMKFQMQVYEYNHATDHYLKAVEVELKQGDNGTVLIRGVRAGNDGSSATDPKGSIKITNWNSSLATAANAGGYGVDKVVIKAPVTQKETIGEIVSYNIYQSAADGQPGKMVDALADQISVIEDADGNAIAIPAAQWNQNSGIGSGGYNTISNAKFYNPTTKTSGTTAISIGSRAADSSNYGYAGKNDGEVIPGEAYTYLKSWLAMKNTGAANQTYVSVSDIAYEKYDLYIYFNGSKINTQSNTTQFLPFKFGAAESSATYYTVSDGALVATTNETTPKWGAREQTTATLWTNAVVIPNQTSPTIYLQTLGASGGIAAFQIVEKVGGKKKVEVDCGTEYLMSDANAVEGDAITLKFADAGGKLLVNQAPSRKYTIKCAGSMEILGDDYTITQTDFNKLTLTQVSGGLTIDATGGLEMNDAVKSAIKAATANKTYTFIGDGDKGVALDYGDSNNGTQLKTHIVFEGGAHTMKYRCESAGLKFGANATAENPTIRVTDGATLTFAARNLCGWTSGNADANGIIRVDDGSKLVLNPVGGTLYWAQRLYLEPGAKLEFNDSGSNFRINGGTAEATAQIYVPASESDMTAKPAIIEQKGSSGIYANNQASAGFAIFVGENSKLQIDAILAQQNGDSPIVKCGAGALEVLKDISCNNFEIAAGSFACAKTISALTIGEDATLDVSAGAPTVTTSLTLPEALNLKGEPVHDMTIITVPVSYSLTGEIPALFNGRVCSVRLADGVIKLIWKRPPTVVEIDPEADIEAKPSVDYTKSTVSVKVNYSGYGDYAEGDMGYQIIIGENTYTGFASGEGDEKTVSFEIDELEGGKIYRGEFQVIYGEDDETAATAPIVIRQGKLVYVEKDPWVNETPLTLKTTGSYDPESGVSVVGEMIQVNTSKEVTFTPTPDPDYVDKCDSSFTISIMADEAIDADDNTVEDDAQAGVQIVADGTGGAIFQFVAGDEWVNGPTAELNKLYDVAISFHYAKGDVDGDKDSVTYIVGEWKMTYDRRENTANKVEEIIFYDGCQFAKLVGTCEIESADPVPQGIKPGEKAEIAAKNAEDAQKQAAGMPVLIPDDELVVAALDTDQKKANYKALFKVVAVQKGDKYVAEVVFTDKATEKIEGDEKGIVSAIVEAIGSLFEGEGELKGLSGQPGLYYGIATDGELVKMDEAEPTEWQIADASGNIIGLKVKKTGKQGFYKVICTPKPTTR